MSNSQIERYKEFLSRPTSTIKEKYLSKSEVSQLIKDTEDAVKKLLRDPKKSVQDKSDAREVLQWIQDVNDTWKKDQKLHPNVILKLMKTSAGIGSGRFGFMKKGFKKSPDGKVPPNFSK
jgi:hypothetical protein